MNGGTEGAAHCEDDLTPEQRKQLGDALLGTGRPVGGKRGRVLKRQNCPDSLATAGLCDLLDMDAAKSKGFLLLRITGVHARDYETF